MSAVSADADTPKTVGCEYSNPIKALGHMFRHLFDFSGRATRKEFIMSLIGLTGLWCVLFGCDIAMGLGCGLVGNWLFCLLCLSSLMVRRYHDFGYTGGLVVLAMLLFPLLPFLILPFLILECMLKASKEGEMTSRKNSLGCSGWGCLTIVVLAIVFWGFFFFGPLVLQPYVNEGQYSGRVLPQVDNIRTKVGCYQYDRGKLPGVGTVQTFAQDKNATNETYELAYYAADYRTVIPVTEAARTQSQMRHFANDIDLKASDLRDSTFSPTGYRYWATTASSNAYAYCVGCFPAEDCGVRAGTGYAVLEIGGKAPRKIAIWKRYKPVNDACIILRPATNAVETAQSVGEGTCWLGHPELYLSDDSKKVEQGIQELKEAGWSFGEK